MNSTSVKPNIYFLSTGRAGTNYLQRTFRENYPELKLTHQAKWSRLINIAGNVLLINGVPSYWVKYLYPILKMVEIPQSTVDPLQSIAISLFLNSEKRCHAYRIIHVVRDPRDYVTSAINWKNQRLRRLFLNHCVPFWQPNPIFCDNISVLKRIKMSKFEYFSWVWNFKNGFFARLFKHNENYYLVRMEDIVDAKHGNQNINKLFAFLQIKEKMGEWDDRSKKKVNASITKGFPNWSRWHSQQAKVLDKYCGKLMREFGYGYEESWKKKLLEG